MAGFGEETKFRSNWPLFDSGPPSRGSKRIARIGERKEREGSNKAIPSSILILSLSLFVWAGSEHRIRKGASSEVRSLIQSLVRTKFEMETRGRKE